MFVLAADAEDHGIFQFELSEVKLEIARFHGAAAGEILGIEIEDDPFAAKIAETEGLAVLRVQSEIGCGHPRGRGLRADVPRANDSNGNEYSDDDCEDCNHFHLVCSAQNIRRYSFWLKAPKPSRNWIVLIPGFGAARPAFEMCMYRTSA